MRVQGSGPRHCVRRHVPDVHRPRRQERSARQHLRRSRPGAVDRLLHDAAGRSGRATQAARGIRRDPADVRAGAGLSAACPRGAPTVDRFAGAHLLENQRAVGPDQPAQSARAVFRRCGGGGIHPGRGLSGIRRAGSAAGHDLLHARSEAWRPSDDRAPRFLPAVPLCIRDARRARHARSQRRHVADRPDAAAVRQLRHRPSQSVRGALGRYYVTSRNAAVGHLGNALVARGTIRTPGPRTRRRSRHSATDSTPTRTRRRTATSPRSWCSTIRCG